MREILYSIPSTVIALGLFVTLALFIEIGFRIGRRSINYATEAVKSHVSAIQGSLLGILALLLGFTFSIALQRFDSRSNAVVDEANAIGTAYLRTSLLPDAEIVTARDHLARYTDLRIQSGQLQLTETDARNATLTEMQQAAGEAWKHAASVAKREPGPVVSGLYLQALNDMFDAAGDREASLDRHVPELVLMLLHITFLMAGVVVGLNAGIGGHRVSFATYLMIALIVLLVFIIIDLDRPHRGLIQVDVKPMQEIHATIQRGADTLRNR